jgi:hypothetical protein
MDILVALVIQAVPVQSKVPWDILAAVVMWVLLDILVVGEPLVTLAVKGL